MQPNRLIRHAGKISLMAALLVLPACGGASSEEKTIQQACATNGAVSKEYCGCFAENMADNLEKADLKKYSGLMKKAMDAKSGEESDYQNLLAEAMASGFDDPEMSMRIGMATQKSAQACMNNQ